jgi:hypothetical protein
MPIYRHMGGALRCDGSCDFCNADIALVRIARLATFPAEARRLAVLAETREGRMLSIALSAQAVRVVQMVLARGHAAASANFSGLF